MPLGLHVEPHLKLPASIADALTSGFTVLTPNQRVAHTLRKAFDLANHSKGSTLWSSPQILALDTWLNHLWAGLLLSGTEDRLLLNRTQEQKLWRSIIADDAEVTGLQSLDRLAELASEAWSRIALYHGRSRMNAAARSPDTQAFVRWSLEFEHQCERKRYLPVANLPSAVTNALQKSSLALQGPGLALADFLSQPPAHTQLLAEIERSGFPVRRVSTLLNHVEAHIYVAEDDASELHQAALWLAHTRSANPSARLALVVPNLSDRRAAIDRALSDVLNQESLTPFDSSDYEFSLGQPLTATAPAACALTLLEWAMGPLSVSAISGVLISPFFGGASSSTQLAAAEFDAFELRNSRLLRPEFTLSAFVQKLKGSARHDHLQPLLDRLTKVQRGAIDLSAKAGYAQWADKFRSLLTDFGWSAATDRDSVSNQTRRSWESALDELATLDFEAERVSARVALTTLTRIASTSFFAPQSVNAAVQVLGPLELGGVPYDRIWFLGADDLGWPVPSTLNPLLPRALQTELGIPGADSERDAESSLALTHSIAHSAAEIVFSYARHGEDQVRRASPALTPLHLTSFTPGEELAPPALAYDTVDDDAWLPDLPETIVHGGARVLELQAACGFRAFAELRLHGSQPELPQHGFDAGEGGTIVHAVMQHFWGAIRSQEALRAMSAAARSEALETSINAALDRYPRSSATSWERTYLDVQRDRLRRLLVPWLSIELSRPPFKVRFREEQLNDVKLGPLHLRLRIDRIDDTDGGPLIIDYKTGKASYKDWFGDRPDAPQLPLYGVLTEPDSLGGLAFAILRAGKDMALDGVADGTDVLSKPKPVPETSMAEQVQSWRTALETLARNFAEGNVEVAPKDYPSTCAFCTQRLLCRLNTAAFEVEEDDAGDHLRGPLDDG